MKTTPSPSCHPLMITLAGLVASCALMAGCGGGSGGGGTTAGTQSVTPTTSAPTIASAASEAASSPASNPASAVAADSASSAPTAATTAAQGGESAKTGSTATGATPTTSTGLTATTGATVPSGALTSTGATAVASTTAAANVSTSVAANATAEAQVAAPAAATASAVPCSVDLTRSFGTACFAAVTTKLADGASATFANAKPGYRGSTQANCKAGTVSWSNEACTAATLLTSTAAGLKQAASAQASAAPADYQIGVYYFGSWKDNLAGAPYPKPWDPIKRYPDREPLLGRYAEDATGVMGQQLKWMRQYGIDYVVFNWYWTRDNSPVFDHALKTYLALADKPAVKFAVQWSNHETYDYSLAQLDAMFRYWANNYFKRPEYQLYNGKPAVYVFLGGYWARNAAAVGLNSAQLIDRLNSVAKAAGLPGVSVIGGLWGGDKTQDYSSASGFAAFTMYNYQSPANIALQPTRSGNYSHSYAEFHQSYANQWDWMIKNTTQNFIVPMSPGWDKRPWGGSTDPLHDDSRGLPSEFALHLQAAKAFMDANSTRTQRMGIICCWNEFGEGSFIEPTKVDQFNYLQPIGTTFGTN